MKARRFLVFAAVAIFTVLARAYASGPEPVAVTGSVIQTCTAWTPNGALSFSPNYDVFSLTAPTGSTSLTTKCTKGASVTFAANGGLNYTHATSGFRAMSDGSSHYLNYQLYQNSGLSTVWGFSTSTGAGTAVNETGLGNAAGETMTLSLYGQIPAQQDVFVSSSSKTLLYQDTVTVTVNY